MVSHEVDTNNAHGSILSYTVGFILSIIATIIPFYLVQGKVLSSDTLMVLVLLFVGVQLVIQLMFFMHINSESKPRWNLVSLIFTLILLAILVFGSMWVMYNLNYHMHIMM